MSAVMYVRPEYFTSGLKRDHLAVKTSKTRHPWGQAKSSTLLTAAVHKYTYMERKNEIRGGQVL